MTTFLVDETGEAMVHPLLMPVSELLDGPVFPDISKLEMMDGKPETFMQVRDAMLAGQTGNLSMVRKRAIPKGGRDAGLSFFDVTSTYYYGKVPNSDFSYAFVLSTSDHNFRRVRPTSSVHDPANTPDYTGNSYYHKIEDYSNAADFPDRSAGGPVAQLNLQPMPFIKGELVSLVQSTFKVTPASLCSPLQYRALDAATGLTKVCVCEWKRELVCVR